MPAGRLEREILERRQRDDDRGGPTRPGTRWHRKAAPAVWRALPLLMRALGATAERAHAFTGSLPTRRAVARSCTCAAPFGRCPEPFWRDGGRLCPQPGTAGQVELRSFGAFPASARVESPRPSARGAGRLSQLAGRAAAGRFPGKLLTRGRARRANERLAARLCGCSRWSPRDNGKTTTRRWSRGSSPRASKLAYDTVRTSSRALVPTLLAANGAQLSCSRWTRRRAGGASPARGPARICLGDLFSRPARPLRRARARCRALAGDGQRFLFLSTALVVNGDDPQVARVLARRRQGSLVFAARTSPGPAAGPPARRRIRRLVPIR